jgi:hypothetical protein
MVHPDYTIGCDAHKHFSLFAVLDEKGDLVQQTRVGHVPGAMADFLSHFPEGTPVALETVGNGHIPAILGLVLPVGHRTHFVKRRFSPPGAQRWRARKASFGTVIAVDVSG